MADIEVIDSTKNFNCFAAVVETGHRIQVWEPVADSEHCPVQETLSVSGRFDDKCYYC